MAQGNEIIIAKEGLSLPPPAHSLHWLPDFYSRNSAISSVQPRPECQFTLDLLLVCLPPWYPRPLYLCGLWNLNLYNLSATSKVLHVLMPLEAELPLIIFSALR